MRLSSNASSKQQENYIESDRFKKYQKSGIQGNRKHTRIEMSRYRGRVIASVDGVEL